MHAHLHRRDRAAEFGCDFGLGSAREVEPEDGLPAAGAQAGQGGIQVMAGFFPGGICTICRTLTGLLHGGFLFMPTTTSSSTMLMSYHPNDRRGQPATQAGSRHRAGSARQYEEYRLDRFGDIGRALTPAGGFDQADVPVAEDPEGFGVVLVLPSRQQMSIIDRGAHSGFLTVYASSTTKVRWQVGSLGELVEIRADDTRPASSPCGRQPLPAS